MCDAHRRVRQQTHFTSAARPRHALSVCVNAACSEKHLGVLNMT